MADSQELLLITSNIGSLFEKNGAELQICWIKELKKLLDSKKPVFIAIHFQEVGGKSHSKSLENIQKFFMDVSDLLDEFTSSYLFIDQESVEEKYTAMGCSYYIHKSFTEAKVFNFQENDFCPVTNGRNIHFMTDSNPYMIKSKFPMSCFSKKLTRIPRKGFLWSKWKFSDKTFDIINIHLPHDACNIRASLKSLSKYAKYRKNTLQYMLERLNNDKCDHQLIFGDFNVRPNTKSLVESITKNGESTPVTDDIDAKFPKMLRYVSRENDSGDTTEILKIEERTFALSSYKFFDRNNVPEIIKHDQELDWLKVDEGYREFSIHFQPTYPHKEDPNDESDISFATVRCPSWCDRILVDKSLYAQIDNDLSQYDSYGLDTVIGDHKPVYLSFHLES